jgi:hypothetical protein
VGSSPSRYYWRVNSTFTSAGTNGVTTIRPYNAYDEWYDPKGQELRTTYLSGGEDVTGYVMQSDRLYTLKATTVQEAPINASTFQDITINWWGVQNGGFAGIGANLLRQVFGPINHELMAGRPALSFATMDVPMSFQARIVSIDQRTHVPFQSKWLLFSSTYVTNHFTDQRVYAPNALAADFFMPRHRSAWSAVLDWLGQHIDLHRS